MVTSYDALTLKAFTDEQYDFLTGGRINKIQQPTRQEFIFTIRNNSQNKQLYINITPEFYHICFMDEANYQKRLLKIPQKPPMFCMLLRKYLENSKIAKINVPKYERILELYIETYNEIGEKIYLCLAIELMGRYSNIILYNTDTNLIIGSAHNVGADKSREREIYGGIPYIYPPKQEKKDILNYFGEVEFSKLSDDFYYFSKNFAKLSKGSDLNILKSFVELENISPAISADYQTYTLFSKLLGNNKIEFSTVNELIDNFYSQHIYQTKLHKLKSKLLTITNTKLKKIQISIKEINNQLLTEDKIDEYRLNADLLMANLYNLKDFQENVNVYDYENDKQKNIVLDKNKTIKENANKFYKLYNKAKNAKIKREDLIKKYYSEKEYLEQVIYSIETAQNYEELTEISAELNLDNDTIQKNSQKPNILIIDDADGSIIYIGKNNKQNDYIISKIASENDLWFHVHNYAGSHVLLKAQNVTDDLILKCVKLAKENSSVKNSSKIGVIYTKRKYLRKPPGANLGYVTYKNEKEIILD